MLKRLRLHNFRTYLNAEFSFSDRQLVVGANNSGKTNLCAALSLLRASSLVELDVAAQAVPGGLPEMRNWAFDSDVIQLACDCELAFEGELHSFTYDLSLVVKDGADTPQPGLYSLSVKNEELTVTGPQFKDLVLLENDGHEAKMRHETSEEGYVPKTLAPANATMLSKLYKLETNRLAIRFRDYLSSWLYFSLSPHAMRIGWRESKSAGFVLSNDGSNLAIVLYHLKNINEACYRRVLDHARLVEPALEAINFMVVAGQAPVPFVALRNRPQTSWMGLSDGTLKCLALAVIAEAMGVDSDSIHAPSAPLVIIEEPENGLFPGHLRRIQEMFEGSMGMAQFVFTSHSPYFINFFDGARDTVTMLRRKKEITEIVRIPPPDDADPDRPLLAEQYSAELFD